MDPENFQSFLAQQKERGALDKLGRYMGGPFGSVAGFTMGFIAGISVKPRTPETSPGTNLRRELEELRF